MFDIPIERIKEMRNFLEENERNVNMYFNK